MLIPLAVVFATIVVAYVIIVVSFYLLSPKMPGRDDLERKQHAVVVVYGDLGHSPRMCFHALSIAKCNWRVTLVGYLESELMEEITANENIEVKAVPEMKRDSRFFLYALKRLIFQHYQLYKLLKTLSPIDVLMVQTPPALPTLAAARLYTLFASPGTKLIVDWHNLGFTILRMKVKSKLPVVLYKFYESIFGKIAYLQLCVSMRLGLALRNIMGINPKRIMPLMDRPYTSHVLTRSKISPTKRSFVEIPDVTSRKLVVTSTSYTPDEDLSMMLEGMRIFDKTNVAEKHPVNLVVTGKGPGKERFLAQVAEMKLQNVFITPLWLSYERYHDLLAVADLGLSLHQSSSGWDLPMKIVDMFGAGLPVISLDFPALKELVTPENGVAFEDAASLADALESLLEDSPLYYKIKAGALREAQNTWEEQWRLKLGPVFGDGVYLGEESSSSSDSD